jgi:putative hydrolase of HD superfamily
MQVKAPNPSNELATKNASAFIQTYFEVNHLKQLYRQGWLKHSIPPERCESVAEHTFGVALMALFLAQAALPKLDAGKVLQMALLHDIGEVYAGDIIPEDNLSPEEKRQREQASVNQVLNKLPAGEQYIQVWEEFERGESAEAQFVRQIDKLEMALQACVYEHQKMGPLEDFFLAARTTLTFPELRQILAEIEELR